MCVCVYIWLYVGRWQGFVFTTSVLAVCACGFLHFTAASSTQPHCLCVFSLFHSVIVSIIKAVFAGRIVSRQRITASLNCWNWPARGSCVYAYARPCSGSDTASSLGLNSPEAPSQVGTSQVLTLHCYATLSSVIMSWCLTICYFSWVSARFHPDKKLVTAEDNKCTQRILHRNLAKRKINLSLQTIELKLQKISNTKCFFFY